MTPVFVHLCCVGSPVRMASRIRTLINVLCVYRVYSKSPQPRHALASVDRLQALVGVTMRAGHMATVAVMPGNNATVRT